MNEVLQNLGNSTSMMLVSWLVFLALSVFCNVRKQSLTPYFLFLSAISLAAAFALLTPFVFPWDEQFHALVAKNLANDPFVPKLIPQHPLSDVSQTSWLDGVVWLHKQPLFTWQMALSIKLFGANAFAVRLPSVLFHGVLVITVYRIGNIVFNRRTGFIAAILVLHSAYLLGLISGKIGTDHNDYVFLCYITLSFWAWFEWSVKSDKKWLYWIGIFVGLAVLTKWLVGLLVFAGWGLVILCDSKNNDWWSSCKALLKAFCISILVFMPWQIYCYFRFPLVFMREMAYNAEHIGSAVESHTGDQSFHFEQLSNLYFNVKDFTIVFILCLVFFVKSSRVKTAHKICMLISIAIIYAFFTLVQTKMPSFTVPVFPLVVLIIAYGLTEITNFMKSKWTRIPVTVVLVLLIGNWLLKPVPTLNSFGFYRNEQEAAGRKHLLQAYRVMKEQGSSTGKRVVFGVNLFPYSHISWMFYNDEIAYPFIPSDKQIQELKQKGFSASVLDEKELVVKPVITSH